MNTNKIVGWVGVAIAVVGAFVSIPYAALILLLLGLYGSLATSADDTVSLGISAFVLTEMAGHLDAIPAVGGYLPGVSAGAIIGVFVLVAPVARPMTDSRCLRR